MKKLAAMVGMALFLISFASGCTTSNRIGDFTVISTKNISSLAGAKKMGEFEGEDCVNVFFQVKIPNMEEALDQALSAGEGNAMLDCVIYYDTTSCGAAPLKICYRVKGTVIKTKDIFTESKLIDEYTLRKETGGHSGYKTTHYNGNTYVWVKSDKSTDIGNMDSYKAVYRIPASSVAQNMQQ